MEQQQIKNIIEAVLMSADKPLKVSQMEAMFAGDIDMPSRNEIRQSLQELAEDYQQRGFELKEVASGFRIQVGQDYAGWVGRLWEEKPARYTRALLETLALIAYRQPITRGGIEEIRGVSVSSNIIKTLQEREWIKVLGHKDVPGKPALYGTSKEFLDYFNLKTLEDLPTLAELKDLDQIHQELDLDIDNTATSDERPEDDAERSGAVPVDDPADADTTADDSHAQSEASQTNDARTGEQVAGAGAEPTAEQADDAEIESDTENAADTNVEPETEQADDDGTGPRAIAAVVAENVEQDPDESEPQPLSAAR